MLKAIARSILDKEERRLGQPLDYMRHVLDISWSAFRAYTKIMPFANYRKTLPPDAYHVARLVAALHEDCGACALIEINLSKQAGVPLEIIRAAVHGRVDDLPAPLANVYRFAQGVVSASGAEEAARGALRDAYGEEGIIELAFAIGAARLFPTTKRALGYATACRNVNLEI